MTVRCLMSTIAAAIVATMLALPADARAKQKRSDAQKRYEVQMLSLVDGRITGRPRTCGYETFNMMDWQVPRNLTARTSRRSKKRIGGHDGAASSVMQVRLNHAASRSSRRPLFQTLTPDCSRHLGP